MHSNDALRVGQDIAEWGRPVIADRAMDSYAHFTFDFGRAQDLGALHCLIWLHLILDRPAAALAARRDLLLGARALGVSAAAIDAIDRGIVDDLLDCVFDRFRDSKPRAADQIRALLLAAGALAELKRSA